MSETCAFCPEPATETFAYCPVCKKHREGWERRSISGRTALEEVFYQGRRAGLTEARTIFTNTKGPDRLNTCPRCAEVAAILHKLLQ